MTEEIKTAASKLLKSGLDQLMSDLTHLNVTTAFFLGELNDIDLPSALEIVKQLKDRATADGVELPQDALTFFEEKIALLELLIPIRDQLRAYQFLMLENDKKSGRLEKHGIDVVVNIDALRKRYGMEKSS